MSAEHPPSARSELASTPPVADRVPGQPHIFETSASPAQRRTWYVVALTAVMMVIEIIAGMRFGSMALLADGWHMSTHALALGISAGAYALAHRHAHQPRFAFGTWKIEVLGAYTSAVLLLGVAAYMGVESVLRLLQPTPIRYQQAITVAIIGLGVNALSAWILRGSRARQRDLNLRSAYLHVAADALTSILAIVALIGGRYFGADWLDPAIGLLGSILVARWALALLRAGGRVLLDAEMDTPIVGKICIAVASLPQPTWLHDLHVWRVGPSRYACIVGVTTTTDIDVARVRTALAVHPELGHVTVEVVRTRR